MKLNFIALRKAFNIFPGSVYGLISFGISIITHLLGVLMYPNYNITYMAISVLGDGYGGLIYRIGLILTGIIALPFCIFLGATFNKNSTNGPIRKIALSGSFVYCISLILIGYFWGTNIVISFLHGLFAFIAWVDGLIFIGFFSILMFIDSNYPRTIGVFGFYVAGTFLLHLLVFSSITQWIMTLSIMLWTWVVSSYMLYKRY